MTKLDFLKPNSQYTKINIQESNNRIKALESDLIQEGEDFGRE